MAAVGTGRPSGRSSRRRARIGGVIACIPLVAGLACQYLGVPASELQVIRVGATRSEVERTLGASREEERIGAERAAVYAFNTGQIDWGEEAGEPVLGRAQDGIHVPMVPSALWYFTPIGSVGAWMMQRGELTVVYGPDDRVVGFRIPADAMLGYGRRLLEDDQPDQGYVWLCLAAAEGNGEAALLLGRLFEGGVPGFPTDPTAAGFWYRVSSRSGDPYADWYAAELASRSAGLATSGEGEVLEPGNCRRLPASLAPATQRDARGGEAS